MLPMAAIIMEVKSDYVFKNFLFFFIFLNRKVLDLWQNGGSTPFGLLSVFSSGWRDHGSMFAVSQIMTKKVKDGRAGGEEKVGGTEWRCSLLSLHTFQSLVPICSSKQHAVQGSVTTMLCPSWLFFLWYWILLSSAEQGAQEPQPACGGDICPLLEPVYLCLSASSALLF